MVMQKFHQSNKRVVALKDLLCFRAEARTQAPLIPGPRGEAGSPRCRAHSHVPYPFCNRYYHSRFSKVVPNHQNPASQASWKVWTSHLFYPTKVLGWVPPGLNQVEPATQGCQIMVKRPQKPRKNNSYAKSPPI